MSSDESKQEKLRQLRDRAIQLLEESKNPRRRRRALDECIKVVKEMNRLESEIRHLRTREQAFKDLASGKLR